jgi:hypothetical protein
LPLYQPPFAVDRLPAWRLAKRQDVIGDDRQ